MKYFIDPKDRSVYAYEEDGSQDSFIKDGLAPLTDEELEAIRAEQALAQAPTAEQLLKSAIDRRDELLSAATLRIYPLQDAFDLGENTEEEAASLNLWKQYRIAVNRISRQPGFPSPITWPEQPS